MNGFVVMISRPAVLEKGSLAMSTRSLLVMSMIAALLSAPLSRAAETKIKPEDQLQFQQKTIQAQMTELQERMFHLAELTREMEPGDSAKLVMAVRKARDAL